MSPFRSCEWSVLVAVDYPAGMCFAREVAVTATDPDGACLEARRQALSAGQGKVKARQVRIERLHRVAQAEGRRDVHDKE